MSSKPHASYAPFAAPLWRGGVLELAGRDAGAFVQAQLMNDVRPLLDGQWQWTGWLSAKGRLLALGALLRLDAERFWLLLPDAAPTALAPELQRYVMRSKLSLAPREDVVALGYACTPAALGSAAQGAQAARLGDAWTLDFSGERPRTLLLDAGSERDVPRLDAPGLAADAWALEDLAHGLPRLDPAGDAAHTPQMLGLGRLRAYSVKKGCYPGQEIVARTHFLGQAKRELQRLQCRAPLAAGSTVKGPAGEYPVLCAAACGDRHEALAVLPVAATDDPWTTGSGEAVAVMPFAEGLAR